MNILPTILLFLYTCTSVTYAIIFIKKTRFFKKWSTFILVMLIITHILIFIFRLLQLGYMPVSNIFEAISSIALAILLIYFLIEILSKVKTTGFIFINISFILQIISEIFSGIPHHQKKLFENPFFVWHTSLAITSYAAFIIGAVYGALYLLLFKNIKNKRFGRFFKRMPSLEELDEMNLKSCFIGFILLVPAILLGYFWKHNLYGHSFYLDSKILTSFLLCILYLFQIIAHFKLSWPGKKRSYLSILGVSLALVSMVVGNLTTNFHNFF